MSTLRRFVPFLLLGLLPLLATCARKEPIVEPVVVPGKVVVLGNRLEWTTDRASRVSVRYGFTAGSWDHMAYPNAEGRQDRAFRTEHSVALLDLVPGRTVHYQTVNEVAGGGPSYSAADSFVATTGPTANLLVSAMIHIGFGDSHLITFPTTGKRLLIDSGTRAADASVETYLDAKGIGTLDGMLATHVHEDHLGGEVGDFGTDADGVLLTHRPAVFFDSPNKSSDSLGKPAYNELQRMVASAGIPVVVLRRGQTSAGVPELRFDPEVRIAVLNSGMPPLYQPVSYEGTNINNESIVLRFSYGDVDFVIGGDAEIAAETSIVDSIPPAQLEVEYAKIHHHGLSDASASSWINTLRPRVGFIPNTQWVWDPPESFEGAISGSVSKLKGIGAHVYVIDQAEALGRLRGSGRQFNISFVTDGRSYEVRLENATQPAPRKVDAAVLQECVHGGAGAGHRHEHGPEPIPAAAH